MGESQLLCQKIIAGRRADLLTELHRRGIRRDFQRILHGDRPAEIPVPVVGPRPAGTKVIVHRLVQNKRGIVDKAHFHRRSIDGDWLDGGARLSLCIRCIAPQTVALLLSLAAGSGQHAAVVVHHKIADLDVFIGGHHLRI